MANEPCAFVPNPDGGSIRPVTNSPKMPKLMKVPTSGGIYFLRPEAVAYFFAIVGYGSDDTCVVSTGTPATIIVTLPPEDFARLYCEAMGCEVADGTDDSGKVLEKLNETERE